MLDTLKRLFGGRDSEKFRADHNTVRHIENNENRTKSKEKRLSKDSPLRETWLKYNHGELSEHKGIKLLEEEAEKYEGQYPIDMHYVYLTLQKYYYAKREKGANLKRCQNILEKDMAIYPEFKKAYLKEHDYFVNYPAFKQMAIILEKQGKFEEAIQVCNRAIELGVECDTKSGFEGRKKKLEKKLND